MLTEKQLNTINKVLENRIFTYNDEFLHNTPGIHANFDYKIKLLGYKKMISVGEWYDYLMVSVEFVKFNNEISKNVLPSIADFINNRETFLYYFKQRLKDEISSFLSIFVGTDVRVIITDYKVSVDNKETLMTENNMSRIAIRTVVKDIINKVKQKKRGNYYLPDGDDVYSFTNLPFTFTVELILKVNKKIDRFKTNGYYVEDEDVIEILIMFNPENIERQLYDLVGELNELLAHELEHGRQEYYGEFTDKKEEPEEPLPYYTQDHEIPAQYKGFKRLSFLTKKPLEVVAKEWFNNNRDIHELSDDEVKVVMDKILNYNKK